MSESWSAGLQTGIARQRRAKLVPPLPGLATGKTGLPPQAGPGGER